MISQIDLLRLTIPTLTPANSPLPNLAALKNWSIGSLLDAIVTKDHDGRLQAQIIDKGLTPTKPIPLPESAPVKVGDLLVLRVTSTQPNTQLQLEKIQSPATVLIGTAPSATAKPQNPLIGNNQLTSSPSTNSIKTWSQPNVTTQWSAAESSTSIPARLLTPWSPNPTWINAFKQQEMTVVKPFNVATINGDPRPNAAAQLLPSLQSISRSIWPQQQPLRDTLPLALPRLQQWLTRSADFTGKPHLTAASPLIQQLLDTIPAPTQLRENGEHDLPTTIRQWIRQWLQHQMDDDASSSNTSATNAQTTTQQRTSNTPPLLQQLLRVVTQTEAELISDRVPFSSAKTEVTSESSLAPETLPNKTPMHSLVTKSNEPLATTEFETLEPLLNAVIARLNQHSINSVTNEARNQLQWSGELPVLFQQRCDVFDVTIDVDRESHPQPSEQQAPRYVIRLRFDLPELGPCQFIVQLVGSELAINIYSERDETQLRFSEAENELATWLSQDNLHLQAMKSYTVAQIMERMQ